MNHISYLNQHCQQYKIPVPQYHLEDVDGPDNSPTFTMMCVFNGSEYLGTGPTKQKAKLMAAKSAVQHLSISKPLHKKIYSMVDVKLYRDELGEGSDEPSGGEESQRCWRSVWNDDENKLILTITNGVESKRYLVHVVSEL